MSVLRIPVDRKASIAFQDTAAIDAFGRLRSALPYTLFDQSLEYGVGQLFWNTVTVGGSSAIAHDGNTSNVILTCGTGATDSVIRQTYQYNRYRPGKSQQASMTGVFGAAVANLVRRVGYFDAGDGIFLEQNGTTDFAVVKRSSTSGAPVDTRVVQASWNLDKLDGSGPSAITLDKTAGFIFMVDLQWIGFGRVRVGFDIGGVVVYVHQFLHANIVTLPYMKTASLPIRYEISNTALQGATHTLRQGCASVVSEDGGQDEPALHFSASSGIATVAVTTRRAVISIRPKATIGPSSKINRVPVMLESVLTLTGTNDAFYEVVHDPTFTGAPVWVDPDTQSAVEYSLHGDAAAGAITLGHVIQSGYLSSAAGAVRIAVEGSVRSRLPIALDMNGANPIAVSLVLTSISGTSNNARAMIWKETR